jgi:hypothetical protein
MGVAGRAVLAETTMRTPISQIGLRAAGKAHRGRGCTAAYIADLLNSDKKWTNMGGEMDDFWSLLMAEVRFQVDDEFLENLQKKLGTTRSTDVARDALTLLNWAVNEKAEGRDIASTEDGSIHAKLAMPSLDKVK